MHQLRRAVLRLRVGAVAGGLLRRGGGVSAADPVSALASRASSAEVRLEVLAEGLDELPEEVAVRDRRPRRLRQVDGYVAGAAAREVLGGGGGVPLAELDPGGGRGRGAAAAGGGIGDAVRGRRVRRRRSCHGGGGGNGRACSVYGGGARVSRSLVTQGLLLF